ncbi:unnamed protein product [Taenia asiatica]|uniref:Uncharacterized protein n=1 Tax=Taenia asiatica TaxID=60517 RepID=A0A0R3WB78_TAEAS|nr:unnamed protein product [Taenia asiatica]
MRSDILHRLEYHHSCQLLLKLERLQTEKERISVLERLRDALALKCPPHSGKETAFQCQRDEGEKKGQRRHRFLAAAAVVVMVAVK